mgnify:FL=1
MERAKPTEARGKGTAEAPRICVMKENVESRGRLLAGVPEINYVGQLSLCLARIARDVPRPRHAADPPEEARRRLALD